MEANGTCRVLTEETAAHETTISHSGICVRPSDNRIRQLAASRRGPKASTLLYMTRRELIVREREVEGHHAVTKVDTLENIADLLTKALDPIAHPIRETATHAIECAGDRRHLPSATSAPD